MCVGFCRGALRRFRAHTTSLPWRLYKGRNCNATLEHAPDLRCRPSRLHCHERLRRRASHGRPRIGRRVRDGWRGLLWRHSHPYAVHGRGAAATNKHGRHRARQSCQTTRGFRFATGPTPSATAPRLIGTAAPPARLPDRPDEGPSAPPTPPRGAFSIRLR